MMDTRRFMSAILTVAVVLTGCATARDTAERPQRTVSAPTPVTKLDERGNATSNERDTATSIELKRPSHGSRLRAGDIPLVATVNGFKVVAKQFEPAVDGEGHVHFYLDVEKLPTTHARPATGDYRSVSRTTYTWPDVAPGEHVFSAQLVGNDHVPLDPPAIDEVRVTVA